MSIEESGHWSAGGAGNRSFARSAWMLTTWMIAVAVPLALIALLSNQTGSGSPAGVALAAAICLVVGLFAEWISRFVHHVASPLAAMGVGMAVRLMPLLAVCVWLGLNGGGREHLAFVLYLLAYYFVVLAVDTYWAIGRIAGRSPARNGSR